MAPCRFSIAICTLALAWVAPGARAQAGVLRPVLPVTAFVPRPVCPLEAFGAGDPKRLEQRLRGRCRVSTLLRHTSALELAGRLGVWRLEQQLGLTQGNLAARLRLRLRTLVGGASDAAALTAQAELAAGLWWQPSHDWALQLRHGLRQEVHRSSQRTELTGAWQVAADRLLYSRWAHRPEATEGRIGFRWWLVPRRVLFDLAVPPTGVGDGPLRLELNWHDFTL
ncbi:MAG: hypothetical protein OEW22_04330 [Rubrivivax sp.]|nr:hypothetical protein [Rubrivivax sp.]